MHAISFPRRDHWAAAERPVSVCYRLEAEAEPDALCRILNLFALQFLTPHRVQVSQHADLLTLEVGVSGLSWHRAEVIAQKMRNLICVGDVSLELEPERVERAFA